MLWPWANASQLSGISAGQLGRFLGILSGGVVAGPAAFDDALVDPATEFTDQTAVSGGWKVQGVQDFVGLP
jgi:hypothetical protein